MAKETTNIISLFILTFVANLAAMSSTVGAKKTNKSKMRVLKNSP